MNKLNKKYKLKEDRKQARFSKYQKREIGIFLFAVFAVMIVSISSAYAIFSSTQVGDKSNVLKSGTLRIDFNDTDAGLGNVINLNGAYPISDSEGQALAPYIFKVTNTGTIKANYKIKVIDDTAAITEDNCSGNLLDKGVIKYSINGGAPAILGQSPNYEVASGTLTKGASKTYELRMWIASTAGNEVLGKHYHGKIVVESEQNGGKASSVILANNPLQIPKENMFDYNNEGIKYNISTKSTTTDSNYVTNGLYKTTDEDGDSYYFRGNVNNIVKFGKYTNDYYVYETTVGESTYKYVSLAACQFADSTCTEANKVKLASAGDDMYWKIIRVNGDGSIRMIYAGTSVDAAGVNAGIGVSRYNEAYNNLKYSGYTYDNGKDSNIKTEVDTWYNNNLKGTSYDKKIAVGKFCSDSSGTVEDATDLIANQNWPADSKMFPTARRVWNDYVGTGNHNAPNLICLATDKTYGGRYNLKAGLITEDEMNIVGLTYTANSSNYLKNGYWFWSMTPSAFRDGHSDVFNVNNDGYLNNVFVDYHGGLVRPVINLDANATFEAGGNGTASTPYVVKMN